LKSNLSKKRAGGVTPAVEHLLSKCKPSVQSSAPPKMNKINKYLIFSEIIW
jgi:hypothetical protein